MPALRHLILTIALSFTTRAAPAGPETTFTYQGQLHHAGSPANADYPVVFSLWDAPLAGAQIGSPISFPSLTIDEGLFTVQLDFGAAALDGSQRWLQVSVDGTTLSPRTPITPSPYAVQTRGLFVDELGKVAIGNTSPQTDLHVTSNAESILRLTTLSTSVATQSRLQLQSANAPSAFSPFGAIEFLDESGALRAAISANASGASAAQVNLSASPGELPQLNLIASGARLRGSLDISRRTDSARSAYIGVDGENSLLQLHGGSVGIGTDTPGTTLDVAGSFRADTGIFNGNLAIALLQAPARLDVNGDVFATNEISSPIARFDSATFGGTAATLRLRSENDEQVVANVSSQFGSTVLFRFSHTPRVCHVLGDVGVKTPNPAFDLHVNGSAGKPGGGSWSNASDRRLKHDIEPLTRSLDRLLRLRGVTFEYNNPAAINELPGRRVGMIAQEVEQVFPDWVDLRADGYKAVTYRGFEALTVEAIRDLRAEKDAQIDELRAENQRLRERLEAIESLLAARSGAVAAE